MERVRFHFDPRCPWCWQTSRWARRLEELGEISLDWGLFCLQVVNRAEGVDPLTLDVSAGPPLRTCILLRERFGREMVGRFYKALGERVWHESPPAEVDDDEAIRTSLKEIGVDPTLLDEAMADPATWVAVVEEHETLVRDKAAFGVPVLVLDGGDGPAIFGPVLTHLPDDETSVELWRHVLWLNRYGNFSELKRGRPQLPDLPGLDWRVAQQQKES
jgi:predicted DsbA family dithiol-disulfide isomerase